MKIEKVIDEIAKTKAKIADYQTRLRELERQKTELENSEIVALVRGLDVAPDNLRAFLAEYQKQRADAANATAGKEETENEE